MSRCDLVFWQARLDKVIAMIDVYEDAILALGVGGVVSYSLDTGQSKQNVTKFDLVKLNETLQSLYNMYATLNVRLTGCGTSIVRPGF